MQRVLLGVSLIGLLLGSPLNVVLATDYFVTNAGAPTGGDGSPGSPWGTITEALNSGVLQPGDVVHVEAGTYDSAGSEIFPLVLVDGVELRGAAASATQVETTGLATPMFQVGTLANSTIVADLSMMSGTSAGSTLVQVLGNPADLRIQNCQMTNGSAGVLHFLVPGGPASLQMSGNTLTGQTTSLAWVASSATGPQAHQLVLQNNTVDGGGSVGSGFYLAASNADVSAEIHNNEIQGFAGIAGVACFSSGVNSNASMQLDFMENSIHGCNVGVALESTAFGSGLTTTFDADIQANTFVQNDSVGLSLEARGTNAASQANLDAVLQGNGITGNLGDGLLVSEVESGGGLANLNIDAGGGATSMGLNTLQGNDNDYATGTFFDVNVQAASDLDAQMNFWGTDNAAVIESHVLHNGEAGAGAGQIDFANAYGDTLVFTLDPVSVSTAGGESVTATLTSGRLISNVGMEELSLVVDGLPVTPDDIAADGTFLTFTMPSLAEGNRPVDISNPLGQSGSTLIEVLAPPPPPPPRNNGNGGSSGGGFCFVATAAYGDYDAPQVRILRRWRDVHLLSTPLGGSFVSWYYRNSPKWARAIEDRPWARSLSRAALTPVVAAVHLWMTASWVYVCLACVVICRRLRRRPVVEPLAN